MTGCGLQGHELGATGEGDRFTFDQAWREGERVTGWAIA